MDSAHNIKISAEEKKAREFCLKVANMAEELGLSVFVVTDGASATRSNKNNSCSAIKNARKAHKAWELENGISPYHDWNKNK